MPKPKKEPTGEPRKPRSTKAEVEAAIIKCRFMIIRAYKDWDIVAVISKEMGVSLRMGSEYVKEAHKRLNAEAEPERKSERLKAIERLDLVIQKSIADKQYKVYLKAQEQLSKLLGINEPDKIEMSGDIGVHWEEIRTYEQSKTLEERVKEHEEKIKLQGE